MMGETWETGTDKLYIYILYITANKVGNNRYSDTRILLVAMYKQHVLLKNTNRDLYAYKK